MNILLGHDFFVLNECESLYRIVSISVLINAMTHARPEEYSSKGARVGTFQGLQQINFCLYIHGNVEEDDVCLSFKPIMNNNRNYRLGRMSLI